MIRVTDSVKRIETFIVTLERDTPYLGPLAPGETVNSRGYIVRRGNGTIYPTVDRSVIVRIETHGGLVGYGETYGICAPRAVCEIINDLLAPVVLGRNPMEAEAIWDELYDLMRVRGFFGGFYLDAIAAIDIGLWDIAGKATGLPLHALLGGARRQTVPAYVSGLPAEKLEDRVAMAQRWLAQGFSAVKFAAVVSHQGIVTEMAALREALGPDASIMADLHWMFTAPEAIDLIRRLEPYRPAFVEAPVKPEDVAGLAEVAQRSSIPIAAGEEWRTVHDALPRLNSRAVAVVQPEMAHTGVTQFKRITHLAQSVHLPIAPHATIGVGIFLAASLHAASAAPRIIAHEYQHSIFDRIAPLMNGVLKCENGAYTVPTGTGHGVEPGDEIWKKAELVS